MTRRGLGGVLLLLGVGLPLLLLPFQDDDIPARLGLLHFIANAEMTIVEGDPCSRPLGLTKESLVEEILAELRRKDAGTPQEKQVGGPVEKCRPPVTLPYRFVFAFGVLACLTGVGTFVLLPTSKS